MPAVYYGNSGWWVGSDSYATTPTTRAISSNSIWCSPTITTTATTSSTAQYFNWIIDNNSATTASTTTTWYPMTGDNGAMWYEPIVQRPAQIERPRRRQIERPPEAEIVQGQRALAQQRVNVMTAARRENAANVAERLLLEHLTEEQRQTYRRNGWFVVHGGKSKRQYRIRKNPSMIANVDVLECDMVVHRLCGHCRLDQVPMGDNLLAQKVMLEIAEDDFLRIANRHAS